MYPQKALAKNDEARDVHDGIWGEVVELNAIGVHKAAKKFVNRECESPVHKIYKADTLAIFGTGDYLVSWRSRRHLLSPADVRHDASHPAGAQ